MKVQRCSIENNNSNTPKSQASPNFKAGIGDIALNAAGNSMQWIQDKGFLASFLIQDTLGMTVPRSAAGFLRDKEITGEYNMQEGFEVIGREGLTGPCMMAVAPIMMGLAALSLAWLILYPVVIRSTAWLRSLVALDILF